MALTGIAVLYVRQIIAGKKTFADVPEKVKEQVRSLLEAEGRGDLAAD